MWHVRLYTRRMWHSTSRLLNGVANRALPAALIAWFHRYAAGRPWSWSYGAFRSQAIAKLLNRSPVTVPEVPFGAWVDERIVEYPWMLQRLGSPKAGCRLLDAGAGLNVAIPLAILKQRGWQVSSITLERERFALEGVQYFEGDLRHLPFPDKCFEAVCCLSTLEHVGMNNDRYARGELSQRGDAADWQRAVREMWRVTAPGGVLRITMPCGRAADHGWFQVFPPTVESLIANCVGDATVHCQFFIHTESGWERSTSEAMSNCECWDPGISTASSIPRAAFSEGIICLELISPRVESTS